MMQNRNLEAGRSRRPEMRQPAKSAAQSHIAARLAAAHYEVPLSHLKSRRRGSRQSIRARHVAIYLAHVAFGLKLAEVGNAFRRDRTTAAYACARIEDARDDPAFDATLSSLETSARVLLELAQEKAA